MSSVAQKRSARSPTRPAGSIASLDIGCSKITCMIGRPGASETGSYALLGGGRQQTRGFNGGQITDMEGLERSIRLAVEDAEREAGEQISSVVLGVTGPKVSCALLTASIDIGGREVSHRDIRRVQAAALAKAGNKDMDVLSAHPVSYRVDDQDGVREPAGMIAAKLTVLLSVVSAPKTMVRNLVECVSRAHLRVERLVPSATASGMGTLIEDERDNGAICIDMGAGVTAVSVFMHGMPAWLGLVSVGGQHVTGDIAQGVGTTFAAAERLKIIYGNADTSGPGMKERIEVPRLGDDGRLNATRMERGQLVDIVAPRIEELFELIEKRLNASSIARAMPRRIVLTGGASQLPGVREVASRVLKMPVRLGRPVDSDILGEQLGTPGFSTAAGLLSYDQARLPDAMLAGAGRGLAEGKSGGNAVNKAFQWLRENF